MSVIPSELGICTFKRRITVRFRFFDAITVRLLALIVLRGIL